MLQIMMEVIIAEKVYKEDNDNMKTAHNTGFTLIELLVVMTIVGILSVIGITTYQGLQSRARDTQRLDDARKIITALEQYKSGAGKYPLATNLLCAGNLASWCESKEANTTTSPWIPELDTSNFRNNLLPVDPKSGSSTNTAPFVYYYTTGSAGSDYCLEIPQENNVVGHPFFKGCANGANGTTTSCSSTNPWVLRFGPSGPNIGVCSSVSPTATST